MRHELEKAEMELHSPYDGAISLTGYLLYGALNAAPICITAIKYGTTNAHDK